MSTDELREQLRILSSDYEAVAAFRPITSETLNRGEALHREIVLLERKIRQIEGLQYLSPIDGWKLKWTKSDTKVHLHSTQLRSCLICPCYLSHPSNSLIARIEFRTTLRSAMVFIDYDELEKHPLYHCGLEGLGAYHVVNSQWKKNTKIEHQIDCSRCFHYLFCFNSCLAEVLAGSFQTEIVEGDLSEVLRSVLCEGFLGK